MKKYLAPILVVVVGFILLLGYGFSYSLVIDNYPTLRALKYVLIVVFGALALGLIVVLVQRIREIKKEDKDDLSNY